jgi:cell division protein FtsN
MRRDYARYRSKKNAPKKNWRQIGIMLLGLLVMLVGSGGYWFYQHKTSAIYAVESTEGSFWAHVKAIFSHKKSSAHLAKAKSTVTPPKEEGVHFDFYTELPNMQVTPAVVDETPAPRPLLKSAQKKSDTDKKNLQKIQEDLEKTVDTEKSKSMIHIEAQANIPEYIVQMGVFEDVSGASQSRLSMLLAGLESDVVKVTEEGQDFYRVQQGPFTTMAEAKAAKQRLERNGVDAEVKKLSL